MIELAKEEKDKNHIPVATIKVVGVGGAGGNAINAMSESDYKGVDFIAINTDAQALTLSKAHVTLQIGQKSTKGLGAGANPEVGKRAAEEDLDKVLSELHDADIVFLVGGTGGGTGSGALPVIVKALKEKGILTIVIVTKPFIFEGRRRLKVADTAVASIRENADTLIVVPNQKLLDVVDAQVSMIEGFAMVNELLNQSVRGVSDIITRAGHINVDFADVREVMRDQGLAVMGTGRASGEHRARRAVMDAISSPLLENMSIAGARGVLLNISGSASLGLHEISDAASIIYEQAHEDANIILGSVIDESLGDDVSVTVIATGFAEVPEDVQIKATMLARNEKPAEKVQEKVSEPARESVEKQSHHSFEKAEPAAQEYTALQREYRASQQQQTQQYQEVARQSVSVAALGQEEYKPETPSYRATPQNHVEEAPQQEASAAVLPQEESITECPLNNDPVEKKVAAKVEVVPEPIKGADIEVHKVEVKEQDQQYAQVDQQEKEEMKLLSEQKNHKESYEQRDFDQSEQQDEQRNDSGLGSNVIQLKDLDVPTFMRKQQNNDHHQYNGKKRNKKKRNKNRNHNNFNNG